MSKRFEFLFKTSVTPYIHGRFLKSHLGCERVLINPVNEERLCSYYETSIDQLEAALVSSRSVTEEWTSNHRYRRDCLLKLADRIAQHDHDLAVVESKQTGKPIQDALGEMSDVIDCFRHFAGYSDKLFGTTHDILTFTVREPLGTVGLITSFNYPLLLTGWKLAPALAAGNRALVRPAPQTPLSTLALADLATDVLPPGVLNVLPGGDVHVSQAITRRTDKTSFTGSTQVGQEIMRQVSETMTPITLECGGKNAVIICEDADLSRAASEVAAGAFSNAGQNCCAISRVLVHASVHDRFVEELRGHVQKWKPAVCDDYQHDELLYGPLIDKRQYTRVRKYIQEYPQDPIMVGELSEEKGYFVPPTVYANVQDDATLAQEEIFGPVLSILKPFETLDEAIERVNQSPYGLAFGIFSRDYEKTNRAARKVKAGMVWINTYNLTLPSLPFGGTKLSGFGKDLGKASLDEFTFEKTVMMHAN
ncbi:hypothetical protein CU097_009072 [Rhizopus azygosporus]|uniref:Aldehyde dehydrogenase domain-containing protein n=1 Tax=Rhizopus azygosporus TaxID=86630 RepID=A0A367JJP3_RHIAZ|nr:hypothetical protein CU097_009072 [Rhizopus azygosporus]